MPIVTKRAYEQPTPADGYRVLVDRIWPRGVSKEDAHLDAWAKEIAPSAELRKWFHHDPARWEEFQQRYRQELENHREELRALAERAERDTVTLVFSARDEAHNNAIVVMEVVRQLIEEHATPS